MYIYPIMVLTNQLIMKWIFKIKHSFYDKTNILDSRMVIGIIKQCVFHQRNMWFAMKINYQNEQTVFFFRNKGLNLNWKKPKFNYSFYCSYPTTTYNKNKNCFPKFKISFKSVFYVRVFIKFLQQPHWLIAN